MSNDKFGDKLREKEKAEEDRYFAQQDKKKIETIREHDAPPVQLGLCPVCGEALASRTVDDVEIDECNSCGGMWLDKGELEQIVTREGEGWAQKWIRSVLS
jgi:predicted NUDIX family phosphoesterase